MSSGLIVYASNFIIGMLDSETDLYDLYTISAYAESPPLAPKRPCNEVCNIDATNILGHNSWDLALLISRPCPKELHREKCTMW